VQPEISKITRVCAYDRAGYGWSDLQPGPRDADRIADQLHALLTQAGINGPFVLMGHSIAGLYIRAYATRYPQNLCGLIFVDSATPLQDDRFPVTNTGNPKLESLKKEWLYILGLPRIKGQCERVPGFADLAGRTLAEDQCRPSRFAAIGLEKESIRESGYETAHTGPFSDIPILIFSQDTRVYPSTEWTRNWDQMQEDLKSLSAHSRRIIAKGSGHYIQVYRPDLLNAEVASFIQQIRGKALEPTDYSSTKTE
jgi:pimeloyl-ACP methyl ester carboxylesterase